MSAASTGDVRQHRRKKSGSYRLGGKFKGVVLDTLDRVKEDFAEAAGLLKAGFSDEQVMAWTHLTAEEMKVAKSYRFPAGEMLSPQELEERAAAVRDSWTDEERAWREVSPAVKEWEVPAWRMPSTLEVAA